MFKGSILAGDLKEALSALEVLVEEAILRITKEEWKVGAVDPANVAMVQWNLNRSAFAGYESDMEEVIAGLGLEVWSDILEMARDDEVVEIHLEGGKFIIAIDGLRYVVKSVNPETIRKEPKTSSNLEWPVQVTVDARRFIRAVKACFKFAECAECMAIGTEDRLLYYESKITDASVEAIRAEVPLPLLQSLPCVRSNFSLDYLHDIAKIIPKITLVMLSLNTDYPVVIIFTMLGEKCQVKYMIAPRIGSD